MGIARLAAMNGKTRLLLIGLPLLLAACGVGASPTQQPPTQAPPTAAPPTAGPPSPEPTHIPVDPSVFDNPDFINDKTYISVDVSGATLVPGTTIRITFQDGQLTAQAGCNTMSGAYSIVDGKLIADGPWAMTEMGCDPARMAQDQWLANFLGSGPTIDVDEDSITLTSGETVVKLVDREVAQPDRQLTGQIWTLNSIITGDAVSSVPTGVTATLQFNDDGTVSFNSGCNSGGGNYSVDGQAITFANLVTTEMACPGPQSDVEAAFLAVLGAAADDFVIDADQLTLTAGDSGLGFLAS